MSATHTVKPEWRIQEENKFLTGIDKTQTLGIGKQDLGDDDRYDWVWSLFQGQFELTFANERACYEFAQDHGLTIHSC